MMKRLLIMTVLLFGASVAFSQHNVPDKENEAAPKTALLQAQNDYRKAVKEKNSPLLIQSLIRQIKYQALIDMDSIPPHVTRFGRIHRERPEYRGKKYSSFIDCRTLSDVLPKSKSQAI